MNRLEAMQIFVRVAELASFTQAADSLGLPKASISTAVKQLESLLGARLLHRTTRKVQLTQDGLAFYERSKDLLADMDELQSMFQQGADAISGRLRVDMPSGVARNTVIPQLPAFLETHPRLELELSSTDRRVDIVREGFDCVLRVGTLTDSTLIARQLGRFHMVNCASPAYLKRYGTPQSLEDLAHHRLIQYVPSLGAKSTGWEYFDGERYADLDMTGVITVNNADAYQAACLAGLGLIQVPQTGVRRLIEDGQLVEVLPQYQAEPMPVSLLYANRRHLPKRVQVFMAWMTEIMRPHLV
ncbi:MAG: LysR family transcriptional regulator [Burkholderiaceae bacterium]